MIFLFYETDWGHLTSEVGLLLPILPQPSVSLFFPSPYIYIPKEKRRKTASPEKDPFPPLAGKEAIRGKEVIFFFLFSSPGHAKWPDSVSVFLLSLFLPSIRVLSNFFLVTFLADDIR